VFEPKTFAATPANARRLLEFNRLKGTTVSEEVRALAAGDTVASRMATIGVELDERQQAAMQRILDWNGRGMLLIDNQEQGREFATSLCKLRQTQKVLVITTTNQFGQWVEQIERDLAGVKVCVYGNPRHKSSAGLPDHVPFADTPDTTADVIITNYISVAWHDLLATWLPDQTFVEEFTAPGSAVGAYKNKDLLAALFRELPAPLFLQNVTGYRKNGVLVHSDHKSRSQNIFWDIQELLEWGVWASCGFPGRALLEKTSGVTRAMQGWGYGSIDAWRMLPSLGVSTELVLADNGPVTDWLDQRVASHHARGKRDGFSRVLQRERDMLAEQGLSAEELVSSALRGDQTSKALIESLRTIQWANAKASSIKKVVEQVGLYPAHSLVIADNLNLHRALLLSLNFSGYDHASYCATLPIGEERESVLFRFLHAETNILKPISTLIVSLSDLDNPDLLHMADNIIFAEWPLDRAIYEVVKDEYAFPNNCRLVQTTLTGTIEEEIRRQVTNL
jgi:hypothetical protein